MREGVRLGIDVGDVRIGVARCDPAGLVASPLETVARGAGDLARIRAIAAGRTHLDPDVQERLVSAVLDTASVAAATDPELPELTPREAEVLKLIAAGLSNSEIAAELVVSGATVKTHVNRIFFKIGARDRAQAVRHAYRHGIA